MTDDTTPNTPNEQPTFHTDLAVGEILRRARLLLGRSQDDVNRDLRLSVRVIDALEKSEFQRIPGKVYIIGFVKTYADYLGLDGDKLVKLLKDQAQIQPERPVYNFPKITHDRLAPPPWVIGGSAVSLILVLMLWSLVSHSNADHSVPPVPATLTSQLTAPAKPKNQTPPKSETKDDDENASSDDTKTADATDAQPKPSVPAGATAIKAIQDCWIDVRNDQGETVFSRVLKKGEEFWVPSDGKSYTLTAGNAGGVIIEKGGVASAPLGNAGQVIRNYSIR